MSFRIKCPSCGRKQSSEVSELGKTVHCPACGLRFVVEMPPVSEPGSGDATIPDIDFFPPLVSSPTPAAAKLFPEPRSVPPSRAAGQAATGDVPATPAAEISSRPVPIPLPARPSVAVPPHPPSSSIAEPLPSSAVAPRAPSPGIQPLPLVLVMLVLVAASLGLGIAIGYGFGHHQRTTQAVSMPAQASPPSVVRPMIASPTPAIVHPMPSTAPTAVPAALAINTLPVAPVPLPAFITPRSPTTTASSQPVAAKFQPVRPSSTPVDLDAQIGQALDRGVNYLLSQFNNGRYREYDPHNGTTAGLDALAVYALLHAGEATHDLRLTPNAPLVGQMLDALKQMPMDGENSTYSRSLRAAALGVYHRENDKQALRADAAWLIAAAREGAYTYTAPTAGAPRGRGRFTGGWDNSNSQYGALGVWAALDAGVEVPTAYWRAVQKHWLSCQLPDGEWGYTGYGSMGRLSMTVAGITTLLVTEDQLDARAVVTTLGHEPFTPALARGLKWLEAGDNAVRLPANWRTYNLFGLERAALASGFKYFGSHDWYRELAGSQISLQRPDGSWEGEHFIATTSYTLLFLSRGRHPIFMNKLRFDGYWSNRPRDIANLSHYASSQLERPLNWQVVSLTSDWSDWMDSPVLYIASHVALNLTDVDIAKLRAFTENGGLIFTHADGDSAAFNKSIADIAHRMFPEYAFADLPQTHPIFSTLYRIKLQPRLQGISNGSRLLLVHSPTDLNKVWQQNDWAEHPVNFQMGMNVFIYAAGKADLRNRLKTPLVPEPTVDPIASTTVAQVRYTGDWNPEPAGVPRFARLFLSQTSMKVNVIDADPQLLDARKMPLAHLTGTGPLRMNSADLKALHDYVDNGGTLLIDACGGSAEFDKSMVLDFLPHAFPQSHVADMRPDNPILAGTGAGLSPLTLRLRPWRNELDGATTEPLQYFTQGKGMVIFSPVDLSTALLGTNTWPVNGYAPDTAYALMHNLLLSILEK
jgi:hypothetical protein